MNTRDHLSVDPSAQFPQSYIPMAPWSRDMAPLSPTGLTGDQTCFINGDFPTEPICSLPSTLDWAGNTGIQPPGRGNEDIFQDLSCAADSLSTEASNNPNQPLYYVATGELIPTLSEEQISTNLLGNRNNITSNPSSAKHRITPIEDHCHCSPKLRLSSRSRISLASIDAIRKWNGTIVPTAHQYSSIVPVPDAISTWDVVGSWTLCAEVSITQDA